jgi:hypothetical protein
MHDVVIPFLGALLIGLTVTWLVCLWLGAIGRVVMIVFVPIPSFFFAWALVPLLGPDGHCTGDCFGNAFYGLTLLSGWILGIAAAALAAWRRERSQLDA